MQWLVRAGDVPGVGMNARPWPPGDATEPVDVPLGVFARARRSLWRALAVVTLTGLCAAGCALACLAAVALGLA
jgi:hypothetical protein